jgi:hypothetical protein
MVCWTCGTAADVFPCCYFSVEVIIIVKKKKKKKARGMEHPFIQCCADGALKKKRKKKIN